MVKSCGACRTTSNLGFKSGDSNECNYPEEKYEKSTVKQYLRAPSVIPVLGYNKEKKYFLMDDKTVGIGFFCTPLNGADEKIQERVNGMLNLDMPAKTIMQFAIFRSPDINSQMYQMQALRQRNVNPLLQAVIDERVRFLKHHTGKSLTTRNDRGYFDMGGNTRFKVAGHSQISHRK